MVYEVHNLLRTWSLEKVFHLSFLPWEASKHCPLSSWRKIVSLFFSGSLEGSYSSCFHFPLNSYLSKTKEKKKRKEAKIEGEIHFSVSCVLIRFRHFCCVWKYIYLYIYGLVGLISLLSYLFVESFSRQSEFIGNFSSHQIPFF